MSNLRKLTFTECIKKLELDSVDNLVQKQNEIVEAKGAIFRSQLARILLAPIIERYELPREDNIYVNSDQVVPRMSQTLKNHELFAQRKYGIKSISVNDALKKFQDDLRFNYSGRRNDCILYKENVDLYLFLFKRTYSL